LPGFTNKRNLIVEIVSYITSSGKTIVATASDASDPTTYRYADTGQKLPLRNINGRWIDIKTGEITNISISTGLWPSGLYMTTNAGLHTVDVSTGDLTLVADTTESEVHKNIRTIFYDPRTDTMYANPAQGAAEFGVLTPDGVYVKSFDYTYPGDAGNAVMGSFALNAAQTQMYCTDYIHLYEFDETNGEATDIALVPGDDPGSCLATLTDGRTFFARTDNNGPSPDYGGLWTLNLATAQFGPEVTVDGYENAWGMRSMAQYNGTVYAIQIAPSNQQNGIFGVLDVDAATFTPIGSVPGVSGQGKYWGLTAVL
jgi:hypothetical protein